MSRVNFDILNIRFQKRYANKGFTMKENTGLDTETYRGYVKLLCDIAEEIKKLKILMIVSSF